MGVAILLNAGNVPVCFAREQMEAPAVLRRAGVRRCFAQLLSDGVDSDSSVVLFLARPSFLRRAC